MAKWEPKFTLEEITSLRGTEVVEGCGTGTLSLHVWLWRDMLDALERLAKSELQATKLTELDPTIGYAAFEGRCNVCSEPIIPGQRIRHVRTDARVIAGAYRPVIIFGHTHEHCDRVA